MDMLCNKCSETWDWFYIRDDVLKNQSLYEKMEKCGGFVNDGDQYKEGVIKPYEIPRISLLRIGHKRTDAEMEELSNWQFNPGPTIAQCPACIGKDIEPDDNAKIRAELAYLYGDDIDGFMADMEDFGLE